jgi:hypothetical protein
MSAGGISGGRGGEQDRGVGGALGPAEVAVAVAHSHTLVSERGEALTGAGGELLDDLDAVDLGAELGEHGGLIPRAGADLEHSISRAYGSELGHEGDHVGLADRDVVADRQGMIGVGSILGRRQGRRGGGGPRAWRRVRLCLVGRGRGAAARPSARARRGARIVDRAMWARRAMASVNSARGACGAGLAERARSGDRRPRAGGRERARGLVTWSEA